MVDNINLNKISPLLSSAERIKGVDRKSRHSRQSPFKDTRQGNQKKQKKKRKQPDETPADVTVSRDDRWNPEQTMKHHPETKPKSPAGMNQKIIDIRV